MKIVRETHKKLEYLTNLLKLHVSSGPLTVSANTESLPSANWLKDLTSAFSPNHTLTLSWAGILLYPPSSCGYWAQITCRDREIYQGPYGSIHHLYCGFSMCFACVYLHENRLKLTTMLSTVTVGKENLMGRDSVVGHSSVSLKHPDYYIWQTVLGLKYIFWGGFMELLFKLGVSSTELSKKTIIYRPCLYLV